MFVGHFGVGFAGKSADQRISLGTFVLASQFLDLLWPTMLLLGIERVSIDPGITAMTPLDFESYPITHSLFMACVWGALFGFIYWMRRKNARGSVILGLCVLSHWVLDLIVHIPDLPLIPGYSAVVGLGLWNSVPGTLIAESLVFGVGAYLYVHTTRPSDRTGRWMTWSLIVFLALVYVGNLLGPPPADVNTIAWVGQSQWLIVAWAYWIDRHRTLR